MKPYLIQRCSLRNVVAKADINGFDSVFSCDYMGSAEFEFGGLPKSLRAVINNFSSYKIIQSRSGLKHYDGRGLWLFTQPELAANVDDFLHKNVHDNWNKEPYYFQGLKENTYLRLVLEGKEHQNIILWWDIENHWFACLGKDTCKLLSVALGKLKERWEKEGDRP